MATLRFRLLEAGDHGVRFNLSDWRRTDLVYRGRSVLGDLEAARLRVKEERALYLPLAVKG